MAQTWPRPATVLSVIGHTLFLALLAIEAPRHLTVAQQQVTAVEVVMVAPPERRSVSPAQAAPPAPAKVGDQPLPRTSRASRSARVTAKEYFASAVLNDPRNKEMRKTLAALGSDERLIQLCNVEAMEQLKRWKAGFVPDQVVAYATADPALTATSIDAGGAAVHAGGKWFRLSFTCAAAVGLERVASFAFTLGRPIPREEWEQDSLPELVDGDPTD